MEVHLVRADLVVVGSLSAEYAAIADDYERRIARYTRLEVTEVKAEPTSRGEAVVARAEGERIGAALDKITQRAAEHTTIITLDSRGDALTTERFAERLLATRHLCLVIGGTMGLPGEIASRAASSISFGRITLPHQLARVVTTEQLYRSFRIARGEPYHF